MKCPNCGSYESCYCTWNEQLEAIKIVRHRRAKQRKKNNTPTVIEQYWESYIQDTDCVYPKT